MQMRQHKKRTIILPIDAKEYHQIIDDKIIFA